MKKATVLLLSIIISLVSTTGCISILERTDSSVKLTYVYHPTCTCADSIALPFKERKYGEDGISQAICTLLLPFTIIDLPFDAVVDTVCLPWDIYRACQYGSQKPVPNNDTEIIEVVEQ